MLQEKLSFLPDYSYRKPAEVMKKEPKPESVLALQAAQPEQKTEGKKPEEPKNRIGTSVAGLVGGTITLGLAFLIGFLLKRRNRTI
jgi:cobalt/nickel transport system permease protein